MPSLTATRDGVSPGKIAGLAEDLREASRDALDRRDENVLETSLRRGCWIYGAGGYGRLVAQLLAERGIEVRGFIDRRANDVMAMAGLPERTIAPERLDRADASDAALVVAVHNFAADQAPIVDWGRRMGFADILIPAELPDVLGERAGSYWLTGRRHAAAHIEQIAALAGILADDQSIAVLAAAARFRMTGDIFAHPTSDLASQYFPRDVPLPEEPLRLIDGGAYTGDIYDAAIRAGLTIEEWYAFEPDLENFSALVAMVSNAQTKRAALFPCGLGDRCEQIRFSSGEAAGSHAANEGDSVAQVVALDQVLPGVSPNFVKLDIEGFERQALAGMRETLTRSRPQLAMSIYHKPGDLWELPLLVRDMLPESRLYIRQHGFNGFDTVLYVVP